MGHYTGVFDQVLWISDYNSGLYIGPLQTSRIYIQCLYGIVYVYRTQHKVYILFVIFPLCISFVSSGMMTNVALKLLVRCQK
jgi:hypothetical protein